MLPFIFCLLTLLAPEGGASGATAAASGPIGPLKVIATVPTYAALAREIGGELVEVVELCRPSQDVHSVTATPSLMARVRDADLLLHTGLDAELWLPDLLRGSGNTHLLPGNRWALALSDGLPLKEVPTILDRSQGDLHAYGNTHVWTDPYAVRSMAARVRDALVQLRPDQQAAIDERHGRFHQRLTAALVGWLTRYKDLKGRPLVVYHKSWAYLLDRFGLEQAATVEPKPRVAPTASHLEDLVATMEALQIKVVLREPFQHPDATDLLAERTGATVLELSTHPGFPAGVDDIVDHFDHNLSAIAGALGVASPP